MFYPMKTKKPAVIDWLSVEVTGLELMFKNAICHGFHMERPINEF